MEKNSDPERSTGGNGDESLEGAKPEAIEAAPLMMTAEDIAECLKVSTRTVWRLKAKGDLPKSVKIGRAVRWRRSDILQWVHQGCPASDSLINHLLYLLVYRPLYTLIRRL